VPAPKRTRLAPQARRAQLIELGVRLLATRRLDELSVELIAQTAGISRGLLFHYFSSKQAFHLEVARAAAAQMLRRTEPDPALAPLDALRAALGAFVDYVEENPDSYRSLVRGAASGDAEMRAIFDETRAELANRILDVLSRSGVDLDRKAELAVHGYVAYAEECVIHWLADHRFAADELLDLLTRALPAVILAASDEPLDGFPAVLHTAAS
jgi:AcrR family transcriptional regulator